MAYEIKEITWVYLWNTRIKKVYLWSCPILDPQFSWSCWEYWCYEVTVPYTWVYCVKLYWAQWWKSNSNAYDWWYWAVASWCIRLTANDLLRVYIWEKGKDSTGNSLTATAFNWWGRWWGSYYRWNYAYNWGWWWWTDVRWWWDTLCHRFIVAWWGWWWTNHHSDSNTYFRWWWTSWCWWYERFRWTQTCAWSNWAFWVGWSGTSNWEGNRYSSPGWWGWWYWWWAETGSSDSWDRYNCAWGGSSYTWTANNCVNHPAPWCLAWLQYITNAYCDVSTHTWNWCAIICLIDTI